MTELPGRPETVPAPPGEELRLLDAYWRAANFLSVGQIYLLDNPLLREPLQPEHVKPRLLGHWGTTPGLNLLYAHMNRVIKQRDLNALYVTGRATAARDWWPTRTWKAPTARCIRRSAPMRTGCADCSASSPSPAVSPAMSHRKPPDPFTKAANSATPWCTRTAPRSTIRTCWCCAWWVTA